MKGHVEGATPWRLIDFYGFPERNRRRQSWDLLCQLISLSTLPWCCLGDFNDMLSSSDKKGNVDHPNWCLQGFREAVISYDLHDVPLEGYPFTWSRWKGTDKAVKEWLDRAMVSTAWSLNFPNARLHNLVALMSDHSPILLVTELKVCVLINRKFRFENRWLQEPDLTTVVSFAWDNSTREVLFPRLREVVDHLGSWGKDLQKKFRDDVRCCKDDIDRLRFCDDVESVRRYEDKRAMLSKLLCFGNNV